MAIKVNKRELGMRVKYSKDLFYSFTKSFQPIVGNTLYLTVNRKNKVPFTNEKGVICLPNTSKKSFVSLKHEIAHHMFQSFFKGITNPIEKMFDNILEDRRIEHLWGKVYHGDDMIFDKRRFEGRRKFYREVERADYPEFEWNIDNAVRLAIEIILHDFDPKDMPKPIEPEFDEIIKKCVSGRELSKKVDSKTKFVVAQKLRQILEKNFPNEIQEAMEAAERMNENYSGIAGSMNVEKYEGRGSLSASRVNDLRKKREQKQKTKEEVDKIQEELEKISPDELTEEDEVFIFDDDEEEEDEDESEDDGEIGDEKSQDSKSSGDDESRGSDASTGSSSDDETDKEGKGAGADGTGDSDDDPEKDEDGTPGGSGAGGDSTDKLIDELGLDKIKEQIKQAEEFQEEINDVVREAVRELDETQKPEEDVFSLTKSKNSQVVDVPDHKIPPNLVFLNQGSSIAQQLKKVKSGITYGASYTGTKININRLINFRVTGKNPRVFDQKTIEGSGLEMVILVDISGSMSSDVVHVVNVCTMLYKAASMVNDLDVTVLAFRSGLWRNNVELIYKCNKISDIPNLAAECGGSTPMIAAVRYAFNQFKTGKKRMFIMLTDGQPNRGRPEAEQVAKLVNQNRRKCKSIGYYISRRGGSVRADKVRGRRDRHDFFYSVFGTNGWYIDSKSAPLVIKNLLIKSLQQALQ